MKRPSVPIRGPLARARFVDRPNRFLVRALLEDGGRTEAHLPDPGRLEELLVPERRIWLRPAAAPHRRTAWTAALVESPDGGGLVSLDTTLPNRLVGAALSAGALPELAGLRLDRAEVPVGASRFDFRLLPGGGGLPLLLEVKSVTLLEDGVGLFPDAVTARGARHLRELAELARSGEARAAVLFVVQRADARRIAAARAIDPGFAAALEEAKAAGVRTLGRRCRVTLERVSLGGRVPVGVSG